MSVEMLLVPKISEKSFNQASDNTYIFYVPLTANKPEIRNAVEEQFKVTVTKVTTMVSKGKAKKSYQKRKNPKEGIRKSTKKAFVTLKEGDKLPFFEETE